MLVWMAVRTFGLASEGLHASIPAGPPEVDIRPVPIVLPAGTAYAVLLRVFRSGLPICYVLVIVILIKDVAASRLCWCVITPL